MHLPCFPQKNFYVKTPDKDIRMPKTLVNVKSPWICYILFKLDYC